MADVRLTQLFTNIANAIRNKKGSDSIIKAADFPAEIESIEVGGGEVVEVERKDVNFYDYEGTLLFSYTLAEAQALTELPTPKGHEGLVFQGWNWDYEDVIALDYPVDIGAMYVTDDGKTRLYLNVENENGVDVELCFNQPSNAAVVDFGDGSSTETSADTIARFPHHYDKGYYILTIDTRGKSCDLISYANNNLNNCLGGSANESSDIVFKIELGDNMGAGRFAFYLMSNLETISVPMNVRTGLGWSNTFSYSGLRHINLCRNQQFIFGGMLNNCEYLKTITLANYPTSNNGISRTGLLFFAVSDAVTEGAVNYSNLSFYRLRNGGVLLNNALSYNYQLESVIMNDNITEFEGGAFIDTNLRKIELPRNLVKIGQHSFNGCVRLKEIKIPHSVTQIGAYCFYKSGIKKFDFSECEQVPTLDNTSAFSSTRSDSIIIVPDALYEDWVSATNWSTYADKIVKASEYTD